jgi:hypothetical protein
VYDSAKSSRAFIVLDSDIEIFSSVFFFFCYISIIRLFSFGIFAGSLWGPLCSE